MPKFNPRRQDVADNSDVYLVDDFNDDFIDDFNDGFSDYEDLQDLMSEPEGQEDWERYLMRMSPADRPERSRHARPYRSGDGSREAHHGRPAPDPRRSEGPAAPQKKRKSRGVLAAVIAVLLLAAVGAYLYFGTDLYYVAGLEMNESRVKMFVGEQTGLEYEIKAFGSGEPRLEWSSNQPQIVTVDEQGGLSALCAGRTSVTLTDTVSGKQTICEVEVHDLTELMLADDSLNMGAGETFALAVQTGTVTEEAPVYVSADSSIAVADADGRVTAVAPGETQITVSCRGFNDALCSVTVLDAPTQITTSVSGRMCKGESRRFTVAPGEGEQAQEYQYTSDDPSVVTVDEKGLMTAVGEGSANVTATVYNGVNCVLPVTVGKETSSVIIAQKKTVYSGAPVSLRAKDDTGSCAQFYYESSDPETVQVDEKGKLHVLRQGKATVTCTSYNGKSAKCEVTAKIVDWKTPYTSQRVYDNIAALAATYPEFISTESIGTSVQGRDITLLKMGTGERKALIVAGMHSREDIAVTFTMRCIDEYAQAIASGKKYGRYNVAKLFSEYTVYFVPLLNPDGMDIFRGLDQPEYTDKPLTKDEIEDFKNTANGVNLNRNFPFEWGHKKVNTTTPDHRSYAGASAGSEPETKAIMDLCAKHEFEWLLDMHCKGNLIYYQDKVTGEMKAATKLARKLYSRCGFVLTDQSNLWEISGGLENWFRKEYGKPGICIELVLDGYSSKVNEHLELKTAWSKTKNAFLMCLED